MDRANLWMDEHCLSFDRSESKNPLLDCYYDNNQQLDLTRSVFRG